MHTYLYYLTEIAGVDSDIISGGFYTETALSPQEYHFQKVGGDRLRTLFTDWAAHNTGGLDYLSQEQVDRALLEVQLAGDVNNLHPYVLELTDEEAQGSFSPPDDLAPRGWSYNVVKINNSEAVNYAFSLEGDAMGSEDGEAHLEARIVVVRNNEPTYYDIEMTGRLSGELSIEVTDADKEIFIVVAAVPEHFSGNQTYGYAVDIERK
jgi:hypothetical protein